MYNHCRHGLILAAFGTILLPSLAVAAPTTMLEKSANYVFGNEVRAFRVPTTDSAGKIKYYDVVIKLTVGQTGVIASTATVAATLSPAPATTQVIVPGTYKASDGTTCTITNMTATSGRIESNFLCKTGTASWEMKVATGPISSGHPFLTQLVAAGMDKLSDAATYSWGYVTGSGRIAACDYFGFNGTNNIIGIKTNGSQIILSSFSNNSPATFRCNGTLIKQ